jgi:hypothetical protein
MATRNTRLIIKNNKDAAAPFSGATLLAGEPIVNTAAGIMMFSGVTSGSNAWTPAGDGSAGSGGNNNFFEVGSNLYNLKIRNKITHYDNNPNLSGKFLSGTTNGFVLADITNFQGVDRYVTGTTLSTSATTNSNAQTSTLNYNITPPGAPYTFTTENTFTTGGTYDNSSKKITFKRNDGGVGYEVDLSGVTTTDIYVTGGTISYTGRTADITLKRNDGNDVYITGITDTYVTGFTYNNNTFTITDNSGNTLNREFNTVTGLTVNGDLRVTGSTSTGSISATTYNTNLGNNLVVYTNGSGQLSTEAGFGYNSDTDKLTVTNVDVSNNVVIQGSLTVFGPSISAFTSQLYVEDDNITLNYNPTGSSTTRSIGAGWTIQDGSGIENTATTFSVGISHNNPNLNPNTEYTSPDGNENRNFYTQMGDIIIRNTNYDKNQPNGKRVLAEGDILDGGTY